jgi:hypothetical protein
MNLTEVLPSTLEMTAEDAPTPIPENKQEWSGTEPPSLSPCLKTPSSPSPAPGISLAGLRKRSRDMFESARVLDFTEKTEKTTPAPIPPPVPSAPKRSRIVAPSPDEDMSFVGASVPLQACVDDEDDVVFVEEQSEATQLYTLNSPPWIEKTPALLRRTKPQVPSVPLPTFTCDHCDGILLEVGAADRVGSGQRVSLCKMGLGCGYVLCYECFERSLLDYVEMKNGLCVGSLLLLLMCPRCNLTSKTPMSNNLFARFYREHPDLKLVIMERLKSIFLLQDEDF